MRPRRAWDWLLLACIALVHLAVNAIWIHHDQIYIDRVPDQLRNYVLVCHLLTDHCSQITGAAIQIPGATGFRVGAITGRL